MLRADNYKMPQLLKAPNVGRNFMRKFETLANILDAIIKEAPASLSKKYPQQFKTTDELNQANDNMGPGRK